MSISLHFTRNVARVCQPQLRFLVNSSDYVFMPLYSLYWWLLDNDWSRARDVNGRDETFIRLEIVSRPRLCTTLIITIFNTK